MFSTRPACRLTWLDSAGTSKISRHAYQWFIGFVPGPTCASWDAAAAGDIEPVVELDGLHRGVLSRAQDRRRHAVLVSHDLSHYRRSLRALLTPQRRRALGRDARRRRPHHGPRPAE